MLGSLLSTSISLCCKWKKVCVGEFLIEVQILINSLGTIDERPSDMMVVEQVFNVLPPSFDSFITIIVGSLEMPTFNDLANCL